MMANREAFCLFGFVLVVTRISCATAASLAAKKAAFGVRAQLLSGWPKTPAAAQSLEWLRDIDSTDAGTFLQQLGANASDRPSWESLPAAGRLQANSVKTYHELLVLNSFYSPRIEALRSLERRDRRLFGAACSPGAAWALVWHPGSRTPVAACDAATLNSQLATLPKTSVELPPGFVPSELDVIIRAGVSRGFFVVYGTLSDKGLPSLSPLLGEVNALPGSSPWRAIFRHADGPPSGAGSEFLADTLTGYGFELAIKSSEYKTHADEENKDREESEASEAEAEADGELSEEDASVQQAEPELQGELDLDGLLFHVLLKKQHRGPVRARLWALKEQLEAERDTDKLLKAWEIKDIGVQATAKIKASSAPLLTLMRLSQEFPAHVAGISRTPVPEALRRSTSKLRQAVPEAAEVFSVNGRLVRPDHSDLSLFPMMKMLQRFFVGVERLVRLGVSEKTACELLQDVHPMKPADRLDWRSPYLPAPVYLVMKDKKTARWPTSLFQSMMFAGGGLAPVRAVLYHMVFVFDPTEAADVLRAHEFLTQTPLPASLHFVMVTGTESAGGVRWNDEVLGTRPGWLHDAKGPGVAEQSSRQHVAAVIAAAFGTLLEKKPARARAFIKLLAQDAREWGGKTVQLARVKEFWLQAFAQETKEDKETEWDQLFRGASETGSMGSNGTYYANSLGVPVPCLLVNGQLLLKGVYEGQQSFFPTIAYEQQLFQQALFQRRLSESTPIVDFIVSKGLVEAFHEEITPGVAQRGGEEGMQKESSPDVTYLQWPAQALLETPFAESIEPDEPDEEKGTGQSSRLGLYHVTVLRDLKHAYLLHTFASHLLAPDRAALKANSIVSVPPLASFWTVITEGEEGDSALEQLAACIRGVFLFKAADEESSYSVNRERLLLLKFLGAAVPAAAAAGENLAAAQIKELCTLGVRKKVSVENQVAMQAAIDEAHGKVPVSERSLLTAARLAGGDSKRRAVLWVCNGRMIALEASSQPVFPRHVQALELMEAQYDVSHEGPADEEEEEAVTREVKALPERLAVGGETLPVKAHGLIAAIRSEALAEARFDRGRGLAKNKLFDRAPSAFRLHLPPAVPDAACPIKAYGILDPLSATAQSASGVLALFGMAFNAEVTLVLNPRMRHSEYPLKRYYREVIQWPQRLADGRAVADLEGGLGEVVGNSDAAFSLATKHVLTAAVHALPTWLVTAHEAEHDMDNLRLADVGDGKICKTTYVLRQLYVEGQAFILGEDGWPVASAKGLQLDMVSKGKEEDPIDDTIVMGNLGYFQVHGNPGLYEVALKPGLSNDTFETANLRELEVSSYITPPYQVRVKLRPGRSHEDLFGEDKSASKRVSMFDRLKSFASIFGGDKKDTQAGHASSIDGGKSLMQIDSTSPTIHIFSVASGHLYEKLLGIMILSVRNNTKSPLHFHFIDNFLSPSFKAFIPQMAQRYNFGYSFVTYKWPSWLNPQSEKQRLIWAYKVLFLDVLFPMDVPKVIFIDADQVVRADVRELWDMDLKGRVYGFVPMGDTNPDTEGFRFWKQGYWKNHLGHLPYHISALYVVDLVEFRRTSIGDQLRGIYNQLSRDPNSLSNLEQDLVNFAQSQVPIYSLPAEWLWCETWCSQESKIAAKTIDLCQNPLTKEPKIVMAKRIISEWQMYHDEVLQFQDQLSPVSRLGESSLARDQKVEL